MLEAIFTSGVDEIEISGLTQWDRGQELEITVPGGLPDSYQVHFANRGSNKALNVTVFNSNVVAIPDVVVMHPRDVVAYVYYIDTDGAGETVKTINMPLELRARPEDYTESPPSFQERVDIMLVEINDKANYAVATSDNAKTAALAAQTSAGQSATAAQAAQAAAAASAEAARQSAIDAATVTSHIDCGTFEELLE